MPIKDKERYKEYQKSYRLSHLEKCRTYNRDYANKNKDKRRIYYQNNKDARKNNRLLNDYNITLSEFNTLLKKQGGKCAICGGNNSKISRRLCVDHNHVTREIRGLLCVHCNHSLGWYENLKCQIESYLKSN